MIKGFLPLDKNQIGVSKEYGISILGKPKTMSMDLLRKQNKIIVVANDIPKEVFSYKWYNKKVVFWKIPDVLSGGNTKHVKKIVEMIIKKVNQLNKQLQKRK